MPTTKIASVIDTIKGAIGDHPDIMYYLKRGFRMRVVKLRPLTISIIHTDGVVHQEKWVYLPHLLNTNKAMFREPSAN